MEGCHSGVAKIPTPRLEDDGECGRRGACQSRSRRLCNGLHVCCEIAGLVSQERPRLGKGKWLVWATVERAVLASQPSVLSQVLTKQ